MVKLDRFVRNISWLDNLKKFLIQLFQILSFKNG